MGHQECIFISALGQAETFPDALHREQKLLGVCVDAGAQCPCLSRARCCTYCEELVYNEHCHSQVCIQEQVAKWIVHAYSGALESEAAGWVCVCGG